MLSTAYFFTLLFDPETNQSRIEVLGNTILNCFEDWEKEAKESGSGFLGMRLSKLSLPR